jgi:hypothetical protein
MMRRLAMLVAVILALAAPARAEPLYGFTAFPFDLTPESEDAVHRIIRKHANMFAIHMDQCLPWREVIEDRPNPAWLEQTWRDVQKRIPKGYPVYLAMTPTADDRQSLAPACGASEGEPAAHPDEIAGRSFDDPAVIAAYVKYLQRNIDRFKPRYVNIGIEMSELSLRKPEGWPAFETLYIAAAAAIRESHPQVKIGIELVLQSLLEPRVADQVRPAMEASDFMCLSFYPYATEAGVAWGAPALPPPPDQWRQALDWVRGYATKPLAMCETGYPTQDVTLNSIGIRLPGNADQQLQFVTDLVAVARRDEYLFVIWFITVDYEKLLAQMPGATEVMWIWTYTGLFDSGLNPKPALSAWPIDK